MRSGGDPKHEVDIDLEVAAPTRLGDSTENGDIDPDVLARLYASHPGGVEAFRAVGAAAQGFLVRSVRYMTGDAGLRQFLVVGPSVSGRVNAHEVAQAIAPEARVVYVLFDRLMLVYAHRLLRDANEGTTSFVRAKLGDVEGILQQSADTLDLDQPVAVLMPGALSFVRNGDRAASIVDGLMGALAPGSHLALTNHASDVLVDEVAPVYQAIAKLAAEGRGWDVAPRSRAEIAALFHGLELLEPGVVPVEEWRPAQPLRGPTLVAVHAAVGRKP